MDYVIHPFTLDLIKSTDKIAAVVQQDDSLSRKLLITLTENNVELASTQIPTSVYVECKRPDGEYFLVKNVSVNSDAQIEIILDKYITNIAGVVCFKLRFTTNGVLHSTMFKVKVEQGLGNIDNVMSDEQTSLVDTLIKSYQNNTSDAEAYAVGTRDGQAVDSTDVTYKNNAKYYSEVLTNLTVSSETLTPGSQATVGKIKNGDKYNFKFGIPEGQKGDTGDAATITVGKVGSGATSKVVNSGDEHNAVLDFTLEKGDAATVKVGTVTSGASSKVVNSGTSKDAILDFTLEKGDAATVSVGTVTSGAAASVTNSGTTKDAKFDFVLPKGDTATIQVGTVQTGSASTVTNSGTVNDAVLNFTLEKGDKGDKGDAATIAVGDVVSGSTASVVNSGTSSQAVFDFILPKGDKGDTGTIQVGTVETVDAGTNASVTNTGSNTDAILNFKIPQGVSITSIAFDATQSGHSTAGVAGNKDTYKITFDNGNSSYLYVQNGINGTGSGNMHTDTYDTNNNGIVDQAEDSNKLNGLSADQYVLADQGNWDE